MSLLMYLLYIIVKVCTFGPGSPMLLSPWGPCSPGKPWSPWKAINIYQCNRMTHLYMWCDVMMTSQNDWITTRHFQFNNTLNSAKIYNRHPYFYITFPASSKRTQKQVSHICSTRLWAYNTHTRSSSNARRPNWSLFTLYLKEKVSL